MPRLTLRVVIGLVCAFLALLVGATTLAITYTVSLAALRDLGKRHTLALATTARVETEAYFDGPTNTLDALASSFAQRDAGLPRHTSDPFSDTRAQRSLDAMYVLARSVNFSYADFGVILSDGGGIAARVVAGDQGDGNSTPTKIYGYVVRRNAAGWSADDNTTVMEAHHRFYDLDEWLEVPNSTVQFPTVDTQDQRIRAYDGLRRVAVLDRRGAWFPINGLLGPSRETFLFVYPLVTRILNETGGYIGVAVGAVDLSRISSFLQRVRLTEQSEAFAVDRLGVLIGSTHATPYRTQQRVPFVPLHERRDPVGCTVSSNTEFDHEPEFDILGCRRAAVNFPYPPLQAVARRDAIFDLTAPRVLLLSDASLEGGFFVGITPVTNRYRNFRTTLVMCIPEGDILGGIVDARNVAIGVTCGVVLLAMALGFGLVYLLLQPLTIVSREMLRTARLQDTEPLHSYSHLSEIRDLQKAYTQMNTAIQSFTRYVPRDVVKDLMVTGQLCTIRMTSQRCTMLFCDIAGFTTICERVPPDTLSTLVTGFFERASRIIMQHDGQIDKFIGDCIMAVWGAPFGVSNQEVKAVLAGKLVDRETMVAPLAFDWDAAGEMLRVRVGIGTGEVLAGNMGSAERMNYTVIGDAVNLASRLEGLNKQFDTRVMVDTTTAEGVASVCVLRLLGAITVVGREASEEVYEVVGLQPTLSETASELLDVEDARVVEAARMLQDNASMASFEGTLRQRSFELSPETSQHSPRASNLPSSSTTVNHHRRAGSVATAVLVRRAILSAGSPVPVACDDTEVAAAQHFSRAARLYLSRNFASAADAVVVLSNNVEAQEDHHARPVAPCDAGFADPKHPDQPNSRGSSASSSKGGCPSPKRRLATSMSTRPVAILHAQIEEALAHPGSAEDASVVYRATAK